MLNHNIKFTPDGVGETAVTLADEPGSGGRYRLLRLGGEAAVEAADMFEADYVENIANGNVRGEAAFQAWNEFDTASDAAIDFVTMRALLNRKGTLVITYGGAVLTMAGAICKSVMPDEIVGIRWVLQFVFAIGEITGAAPEEDP